LAHAGVLMKFADLHDAIAQPGCPSRAILHDANKI
jgi:hypothetical protein